MASLEQARVLVVEDEEEIRELISLHLERAGLRVDQALSAEDASGFVSQNEYDLLVVDWMLPGVSGVDMAKLLRQRESSTHSEPVPILMVTAKAESANIIEGLEAGADDYLTKPFDPAVLLARVRALLRRRRIAFVAADNASSDADTIRIGALTLLPEAFEAKCGEDTITLTPSEFKLLMALASNQGRVLTRDSLISQIQGEGVSVVGRTVDTHVFGLRKKLGACADTIETVRGIGYRVKAGEN